MLRRFWLSRQSFEGGLFLPMHREMTADSPIQDLRAISEAHLPLPRWDETSWDISVRPGDDVAAGAPLACSTGRHGGLTISSPVTGKVAAVGRVDTARDCDLHSVKITAKPPADSQSDASVSVRRLPVDPSDHSLETLCDRADRLGLISSTPQYVPLSHALRQAAGAGIRHIILNGMDSEPYMTATRRVLLEATEAVIAGGTWLREAVGAERLWLVVDRDDHELQRFCTAQAHRTPVRVRGLLNKYPQSHPTLLTKAVTGRVTPYRRSTMDVGVWVIHVADLADLATDAPCVSRVVTVTGTGVTRKGNFRVPLGTSYGALLEHVGVKEDLGLILDGGPMTGRAIGSLDAVIDHRTCAVMTVARHAVLIKKPGPCIRCGWCQADCPVQLDPRALLNAVECDEWNTSSGLYPDACLECGLCSYVCPSELPLSDAARRLKRYTETRAATLSTTSSTRVSGSRS